MYKITSIVQGGVDKVDGIHADMILKTVDVLFMEEGRNAILYIEETEKTIRTSVVQKIAYYDNGDIEFSTLNTEYYLSKI